MKINRESLKQAVRDHIETLCNRYLSQGSKVRGQWVVGNVSGDPANRLKSIRRESRCLSRFRYRRRRRLYRAGSAYHRQTVCRGRARDRLNRIKTIANNLLPPGSNATISNTELVHASAPVVLVRQVSNWCSNHSHPDPQEELAQLKELPAKWPAALHRLIEGGNPFNEPTTQF
jgi:hypothetical protein